MTDKYAVIGNPIAHSKSPLIHATFAKQFEITDTPQDISYDPIFAPLDGFETTVCDLIKQGYKGANVTVPFKLEAYHLCDYLYSTATSSSARAVNTLIFNDNRNEIEGTNTDGIGLRNDIEQNLGFSIENKDILILGAGGAADGILISLIGAKSITIANRTLEKALRMVTGLYDTHDYQARINKFEELNTSFDLIVNATSTGLSGETLPLSDSIFNSNTLAYDLMYGRETAFMAQARANGAQVADGLGMLVEQAAEAFHLWRGVRPQTAPVIAMLRNN